MGVIQRQSTNQSIAGFIGTAIGAVSTIFIYPIDLSAYGSAMFLITTATFLFPFFSLGITNLTIRFFPDFKNEEGNHNGLLPILLILATICFAVFSVIAVAFYKPFLEGLKNMHYEVDRIEMYSKYIWILSYVVIISTIFTNFISNFNKVVIPFIINNVAPKVLLPAVFFMYTLGYYSLDKMLLGVIIYHVILVIGLVIYLVKLGQFGLKMNWKYISRPLARSMTSFALIGLMSAAGGMIAMRIDIIMLTALVGATGAGSYAIFQFMSNTIEVPTRSVISIAAPIISTHANENEWQKIGAIYKKSSINLLSIGLLLFLVIWMSIYDIVELTPNSAELRPWVYILLVLGLGKLTNMLFSVNNQIILYSKYYYVNLIAMLVLAVANVIFNLVLIPEYGILGAAIATLMAIVLHSIIKSLFIYIKFKIHPFGKNTFYLILLTLVIYFGLSQLPLGMHPVINIGIRSILIIFIYLSIVLKFDLAPEIAGQLRGYINKLTRRQR